MRKASESPPRDESGGQSARGHARGSRDPVSQTTGASRVRVTKAKKAAPTGPTSTPPARASKPRTLPPPATVEDLLQRAMTAKTPRSRALWARRGLAARRRIDRTTRAMLLRQLYLAHYETRRFEKALEVSRQSLTLGVLLDVVHQDAARAAQALGDLDAAVSHLRLAARVAPVRRRAFHWWTMGSVYFLAGRYADAVSALTRAARWGTTDKPLYQGHLAMARIAAGEVLSDVGVLLERLAAVPAGQGYGRFVLGHLAFHGQRWDEARRYLEAFVTRSTSGRVALAIALDGEVALARKTLALLAEKS